MLYVNVLLAVVLGATTAIYVPMIAQSARIMGAPVMGNVPFFAVAFLSSVVIAFATGARLSDFARVASLPTWMFVAGIFGAVMIVGTSYLIPRIGTGTMFVGIVTGQIVLGLLIDQFGFLNLPVQPITLIRALGAAMVIGGAAIVTFANG